MKRFLICMFVLLATVACNSEYDDTAVWDSIKALEQKTQAMENVLNAQKNKLTITSVRTTSDGFIITFSDGTSAVVTNGEDGKDGADGEDGETLIDSIKVGEDYVTFILTDGSEIVIPLYTALSIDFDVDDTIAVKPNENYSITYSIFSPIDEVEIEVLTSADIRARVVADDKKNGTIEFSTGEVVDEYSKLVVLVSNGEKVIMRRFGFEQSTLTISDNALVEADPAGGEFELEFLTNVDYEVIISDDAKSWVHPAESRAVESHRLKFVADANKGLKREGRITIKDKHSEMAIEYHIVQYRHVVSELRLEADNGIMPTAGVLTAQYADTQEGYDMSNIIDGDPATYYTVEAQNYNFVWRGERAARVTTCNLTVASEQDLPVKFSILASNDGSKWKEIFVGEGSEQSGEYAITSPSSFVYFKLQIHDDESNPQSTALAEWSMEGVASQSTILSLDEVVKRSYGSSYSALTPMGNHYANRRKTTAADKEWLSNATNEPATLNSAPGYSYHQYDVTLYPYGDPVPADVNQHGIGDCSALAVFAEMAYSCPDFIKSIITDNGDGTFTVKMYDPQGERVDVGITSKFLGDGNGIGAATGKNGVATWATVLEKAIMKWNKIYEVNPDIGGIGSEHVAPLFTGDGNSFAFYPGQIGAADLKRVVEICLEEGMIVIGGFNKGGLLVGGYETVTAHAYSFMYSHNSSALFAMRNPWGWSPRSNGKEDGVLNVVNGEVPPTVDLRIIYPGQASNYSIECLMPYTPPAF